MKLQSSTRIGNDSIYSGAVLTALPTFLSLILTYKSNCALKNKFKQRSGTKLHRAIFYNYPKLFQKQLQYNIVIA